MSNRIKIACLVVVVIFSIALGTSLYFFAKNHGATTENWPLNANNQEKNQSEQLLDPEIQRQLDELNSISKQMKQESQAAGISPETSSQTAESQINQQMPVAKTPEKQIEQLESMSKNIRQNNAQKQLSTEEQIKQLEELMK